MDFGQAFNISRGLENGWAAFKRAPIPLFLGALLMQCTESGGGRGGGNSGGSSWDDGGSSGMDFDYRMELSELLRADVAPFPSDMGLGGMGGLEIGLIVGMVLLGLFCGVLLVLFRSFLHTGYLRLHVRALESEGSFGDLFSGMDRLFPMLLWKLLKGFVSMGAFVVSALPGIGLVVAGLMMEMYGLSIGGGVLIMLLSVPVLIYVGLGLSMGDHAVALDELGPTAALEKSWSLVRGNRIPLFLFLFVYGLARIASLIVGVLMLCIGAFFTVPTVRAITDIGFTQGYLLLTGRVDLDSLAGAFD